MREKRCWRQSIKAPSKRGYCGIHHNIGGHCRSGPRLCSHKGTITFDRNWNNTPIPKYDAPYSRTLGIHGTNESVE